MNHKLLIVLLVVLVVLFVVAVGVGASVRSGSSGDNPNWIESLGERLVPKKGLKGGDVSTAIPDECRELLTEGEHEMPANATCTLQIGESRSPVRTLTLRQVAGDIEVSLNPRPKKLPTATLKLGKKWSELQVFKEGGELTVKCGAETCKIERSVEKARP